MTTPSDIAKNNRGREDVGIYMSYKTFDQYLEDTRIEERQKIIKLLNDNWTKISDKSIVYLDQLIHMMGQ